MRELPALKVFHHEFIVRLGNKLAEFIVCLFCRDTQLLGNLAFGLLGAVAVARLHTHQVDNAVELIALAPRQRHGTQAVTKTLLEQRHRGGKVRLGA